MGTLPNIDCNNSEVKNLLHIQKNRTPSPNPTFLDNEDERSMDVDDFANEKYLGNLVQTSVTNDELQDDFQKAINMSLQSQPIKT